MLYKRPMFKMGGSPTGIETLEPRKKFQFGTSQFSFLEPGLQRELRSSFLNRPDQFRFTPSAGVKNPLLRGGLMTLPFAPTATMAYLNRPKTVEALKFMKDAPDFTFDETNLDVGDFYKELSKKNKEGEPISFLDAFFLDPETGTYPKFAGRVEDQEKRVEKEKEEKEDNLLSEQLINEAKGRKNFQEIVSKAEKDFLKKEKKNEEASASNDTKTGGKVEEDSFDSMFNKQLSRLEKYLGSTNKETKGKVALALSDAVGTPGTLADKAAVLNKRLLNIAAGKKKDKSDLAKIAFAATTELEKANIAAGKKGFSERRFDEYANLATLKNRTSEQERRFQILKDGLGIKTGLTGPSATAAGKIANEVNKSIVDLQTAAEDEQANIQSEIIAGINQLLLIQGVNRDNVSGIIGFDVSNYLKADGGRIQKAMGGPTETPAEPVATNLTFEQLRTRLPKEITDDVVRLVATSEEALQDFAYIRTQGDVEKFNVKYGVNLVLPQNTA
jgi:hypothetical protein